MLELKLIHVSKKGYRGHAFLVFEIRFWTFCMYVGWDNNEIWYQIRSAATSPAATGNHHVTKYVSNITEQLFYILLVDFIDHGNFDFKFHLLR